METTSRARSYQGKTHSENEEGSAPTLLVVSNRIPFVFFNTNLARE